jgi:hypothetical protein
MLEADEDKTIFDDDFFKRISSELTRNRSILFKIQAAQVTLAAFVILGFFFPEMSISFFGLSPRNSAAMRELALFTAACLSLAIAAFSLRIVEFEDMLIVYAHKLGEGDAKIADYLKVSMGVWTFAELLPQHHSKSVQPSWPAIITVWVTLLTFVLQILLIPIIISGMLIYVIIEMWSQPGLPSWVSHLILGYSFLAFLIALLIDIFVYVPIKYYNSQPL